MIGDRCEVLVRSSLIAFGLAYFHLLTAQEEERRIELIHIVLTCVCYASHNRHHLGEIGFAASARRSDEDHPLPVATSHSMVWHSIV